MGGTKNPDIPRILSQRPDLVILERDENTLEAARSLEAAGIPLLVLEIRSVRDCLKALLRLGEAVGAPEEARKWEASLRARLGRKPRGGKRALVLVWKDPWMCVGPETYVGDLARRAGLRILGPARYGTLGDVDLETLDPEVVLLPDEPFRFTRRHAEELGRRLPRARIIRVEGRALTWYLSRTEAALEQMDHLLEIP
jgi:ABC-type Fe3+-hydroxamate transport system substrate-binding protein